MRLSVFLLSMLLAFNASAGSSQTIGVVYVGVSDNTGSVFMNIDENLIDTNCAKKNQIKVNLDNRISQQFYSAALMALASGKKMTIYYDPDSCIDSATKADVAIVENF